MRKSVLFSLGLTFFLPACCLPGNPHHPQLNMAERLQRSTVALVHWTGKDSDGDKVIIADPMDVLKYEDPVLKPYCAGVWITKDAFVTAAHCVDDIGEPIERQTLRQKMGTAIWKGLGFPPWNPIGQETIYSAFGDISDSEVVKLRVTHPCRIMSYDAEHDLAWIQALPDSVDPIPEHLTVKIAETARIGEDIDIMGHTTGLWWSYTRGWIGAVRPNYDIDSDDEKPADLIQVSANIWHGNSGGGAFNQRGELLGIVSEVRRVVNGAGVGIGWVIPYFQVKQHLKEAGFYDHR